MCFDRKVILIREIRVLQKGQAPFTTGVIWHLTAFFAVTVGTDLLIGYNGEFSFAKTMFR